MDFRKRRLVIFTPDSALPLAAGSKSQVFANVSSSFEANCGLLSLRTWSDIPKSDFSVLGWSYMYLPWCQLTCLPTKEAVLVDFDQIFFILGEDISAHPLPGARGQGLFGLRGCIKLFIYIIHV